MNSKRYLKNTASGAFLQAVTIISGLVVPIIILQAYGSTLNGLMSSIKQFINYLTLVEAGLSTVAIAALYKPISENDVDGVNGIVSASRIFYNKTGMIFSSLVVLTAIVFPFFIGSQVNSIYTGCMVLVIGISGTLEYFIIGKYRVLLTADQRGYVITNIQALGLIMNTIATIALVKMGFGLITVQVISGAVYLLRAILIKSYVAKNYKNVSFKAEPNNNALSQRWDALIHQIAAMVVFNTDVLLLTLFSTLAEVSVYSIYRLIFSAISSLISVFANGMGPALGNMQGGSKDRFNGVYRMFENMHYILLAFIYSSTFVLFIPFIKIYTARITDANYIRPEIMVLFLIAEVMNQIRIPSNTIVNVKGLFKETKNRAILEAAINLTVSLLLVKQYGMVGVLIGTICSYAYRTMDFIIFTSKRILHSNVWTSIRIILLNLVLAVISVSICSAFLTIHADSYLKWVMYAVVVSIISFIILVLGNFLMNREKFMEMAHIINGKILGIIKKL